MNNPESTKEPSIPRLSDEVVAEICGGEAEWNEALWERLVLYLAGTEDGKRLLLRLLGMHTAQPAKKSDAGGLKREN